jgi:MFS family permease
LYLWLRLTDSHRQGPGGLLAVPLAQRFGWLPVLFWSQLCTLITTIGATYAKSYAGFTACRTLQGFFGAPPQVLGLQVIYSLFFFHQRARAINIWAFSFLLGPYLGPFLSGFIVEKLSWRHTFGVLCGFYGFSVLLIFLLGKETTFNRDGAPQERRSGFMGRIAAVTGIQGVKESGDRPSMLEVSKDLFGLLRRPYLLVPSKSHPLSLQLNRSTNNAL